MRKKICYILPSIKKELDTSSIKKNVHQKNYQKIEQQTNLYNSVVDDYNLLFFFIIFSKMHHDVKCNELRKTRISRYSFRIYITLL